jgi:hypothetical protein
MPSIDPRCHELRIDESTVTWRIFYRTDPDAIEVERVDPGPLAGAPRKVHRST